MDIPDKRRSRRSSSSPKLRGCVRMILALSIIIGAVYFFSSPTSGPGDKSYVVRKTKDPESLKENVIVQTSKSDSEASQESVKEEPTGGRSESSEVQKKDESSDEDDEEEEEGITQEENKENSVDSGKKDPQTNQESGPSKQETTSTKEKVDSNSDSTESKPENVVKSDQSSKITSSANELDEDEDDEEEDEAAPEKKVDEKPEVKQEVKPVEKQEVKPEVKAAQVDSDRTEEKDEEEDEKEEKEEVEEKEEEKSSEKSETEEKGEDKAEETKTQDQKAEEDEFKSSDADAVEDPRSKQESVSSKGDTSSSDDNDETSSESKDDSEDGATDEANSDEDSQRKAGSKEECQGRYIYMYSLPEKFNKKLVDDCENLVPWINMCPHFQNDGLGQHVQDSETLLPPGRWHITHQYALEVLFHNRMRRSYPCLTKNPEEAELYYIPFYAALDVVRWQQKKDPNHELRDQLSLDLVEWLEKRPQFSKRDGEDHVLVVGKSTWDFRRKPGSDWGNRLLELPAMQKVVKLLLDRDIWRSTDIGVPHPTNFHPRTDRDMLIWQKHVYGQKRESKVSFAGFGGIKANLREILTRQCQEQSQYCRFMECVEGVCSRPEAIMGLYMKSDFCLIPPGDSNTRRAVFDSMIAGCIPVLFDIFSTSKQQYQWHLPKESSNFSIFINENDVRESKKNVIQELTKISLNDVRRMRRTIVWQLLPQLVYKDPRASHTNYLDAFDVSIKYLLDHVKAIKAKEALTNPKPASTGTAKS